METKLTVVKSPRQIDLLGWYEKTQEFIEQADLSRFEMLYSLFYQKDCQNMKGLVLMKMMQENFDWKDAEVFGNCNYLKRVQVHLGRIVDVQKSPDMFEFATFSKLLKLLKRETGDDLIMDTLTTLNTKTGLIALGILKETPKAVYKAA